jgi:hypothetical protein
MAASGAGTQDNPYVVDNWADFLTVCSINTTTYIVWDDSEEKVVDFNEINPQGYDSTIEIKGNVDFNGWELRNLTSTATYVLKFTGTNNNKPTVKNLKITSAKHVIVNGGGAFLYESYVILENLSISYEFDYGGGTSYAINQSSGTGKYYRIGIYAYGMVRGNSWSFFTASTRDIRYGRFHCEVQATSCNNVCNANLVDCVVSGELTIDNDNVTQVLVGASNSTLNVIRIQSNKAIRYNGSGISLKVDRNYTGDIVRPNISTWDEHVLLVNTAQARTQQADILAAGFPLHRAVDD